MKIPYKNTHLNINLIFGILWLVYFLLQLIFDDEMKALDYGWLIIALVYLGAYFYHKHYKYLTLKNGVISINGPLGKKVKLSEIKQIKTFAGDYILKTDKKQLTINSQLIDPKSLTKLNTALEALNVEWL